MRNYIITYDIDGQVFDEYGKLVPGVGLRHEISAQNQKEARRKFREIWYGLWHSHERYYIRKIERKETK